MKFQNRVFMFESLALPNEKHNILRRRRAKWHDVDDAEEVIRDAEAMRDQEAVREGSESTALQGQESGFRNHDGTYKHRL